MVTSISDREPQVSSGASDLTDPSIKLTVTGVDQKGQMFRESSEVLSLDGRDCRFRSKFQPELGSWVLVEINYSIPGKKPCSLQGEVKSVQNEGIASNLNQIQVELEMTQDVKFEAGSSPAPAKIQKASPAPVAPAKIESKESPKIASPAPASPQPGTTVQAKAPVEIPAPKPAPPSRDSSVPVRVEAAGLDLEKVKSAVLSDLNQRMDALKNSLTKDLEQKVQGAVNTGVEQAIRQAAEKQTSAIPSDLNQRMEALKSSLAKELEQKVQVAVASNIQQAANEAVEKQISGHYQATIHALNSDLIHQLVGRLAENQELRSSLEKMAKNLLEQQTEQARNALISAQKSVESRAMEIVGSLEESLSVSEGRIVAARESLTATLESMQTREAEASQRFQESVEKLDLAARSMIEKFNSQVTGQLNSWSAQFKTHLDRVSSERAAQYAKDLEENLPPHVRNVEETMGKIAAGLQLMQGTARLQEERLAELSRSAAADFEKEIRAVLLRLAETV